MPSQFKQELITASLFSYFQDQFPLVVTIAYPGVRIDTAELDEWLELSITEWTHRPQRRGGLKQIGLLLTVNCFVKQNVDKSRIHELADAVVATISQKTVPLRDYDVSGTPIIGYGTLREPETRDQTRRDADAQRHAMQHVVVICPGIAQQT